MDIVGAGKRREGESWKVGNVHFNFLQIAFLTSLPTRIQQNFKKVDLTNHYLEELQCERAQNLLKIGIYSFSLYFAEIVCCREMVRKGFW